MKTPQDNLKTLSLYYIPLILISKLIRWTILWNVLIGHSIGFRMVIDINKGTFDPFHSSIGNFDEGGTSGIALSNAEALFSAINILGLNTYIQWEIFFTIVFNIIIYSLVYQFYQTTPNINWKQNTLIYMSIAILNIFCLNMSKEPYQLIFFTLMGYGIIKTRTYKNKSIWLGFVLILTILFARKYYVLVLFFFIVIHFFVNRFFVGLDLNDRRGKVLLFKRIGYTVIFLAITHFVLYQFIAGQDESAYEELISVNDRSQTRKSVATSEIVPIFGSDNQFLVTMEFFLKIFRLSFPIELIPIGKFTYVFVIVFQGLLLNSIAKAFDAITHISNKQEDDVEGDDEEEEDENKEAIVQVEYNSPLLSKKEKNSWEYGEEEEEEDTEEEEEIYEETQDRQETRKAALYLYIAFLLCSACFEPDFGSWTRHLGVAFPIILFIL